MEKTVVIIGMGQLGRIFAGGLLRTGHTVVPINRSDNIKHVAEHHAVPQLVLVAVAETDLHPVLSALPTRWHNELALLQNELLPRDWEAHGIFDPTVISVWFEKKRGTDAKPLLSSPVYGRHAHLLTAALESIELPVHSVTDREQLLWELVRKNLYILTTNIAGLVIGGDVGTLWHKHRDLAEAIAADVLDIQDALTHHPFQRERLMRGLADAIEADLAHACAGRTAPVRLKRALQHADEAGLAVPTLRRIAAEKGNA